MGLVEESSLEVSSFEVREVEDIIYVRDDHLIWGVFIYNFRWFFNVFIGSNSVSNLGGAQSGIWELVILVRFEVLVNKMKGCYHLGFAVEFPYSVSDYSGESFAFQMLNYFANSFNRSA